MNTVLSDPATDRRARRRLRTEELILEAAARAILEKGPSAVTMQDIAEASDVAQGTLYNYFPNKEALTVAVVRRMMKSYGSELLEREQRRPDFDPLEMVALATVRLIARGVEDPFWRVLIERYDVLSDALHDELEEYAARNLADVFARGMLPLDASTAPMLWRMGAWAIVGAIRDIVQGRLASAEARYEVARHVLMQQGVTTARAREIVETIRVRDEKRSAGS